MIKYFKKNMFLLKKYLLIIIFNILLYILTSFYFKNTEYQPLIMLMLIFVSNLFIYKGNIIFKYYLDIICNLIVGLLLMVFIHDSYIYSVIILSIFIPNNIVFMRSRISDNFFKRSLQYALSFFITILNMFISLFIALNL